MSGLDTSEVCQYHTYDHQVIGDLKSSVALIIEGQQEMRSSIVQLLEAFKYMDRLELRLEKIEEERRRQGEKRDKEIAELKTFMNKAIGYIGAAGIAGGILMKFVGVI